MTKMTLMTETHTKTFIIMINDNNDRNSYIKHTL